MSFTVIIPARYASTRLPGKPLADISGKPMVIRVLEQAQKSSASKIIIATDHQKVYDAVKSYHVDVILTSPNHQSGTTRIAEVISHYNINDDEIIVNVQGDEPMIPPELIDQVAHNIKAHQTNMATLAEPILTASDVFNPNIVKVVTDKNGYAIYFSRAVIPWDRDQFASSKTSINAPYFRHIGIYAYLAGFVKKYVTLPESALEQYEKLEQLRVLWHGEKIHVDIAKVESKIGIDTPDDLEKVRQFFTYQSQI